MFKKAAFFIKDVRNELAQVSWSSPRELWESTKVVFATVALLSVAIGAIDLVCAKLMSWIVR